MTGSVSPDARLLGGRYRLLAHLGSGGMGSVHRAHDQLLDRPVAVKLLHDQPGEADDVRRARLRAEARFAGALRHPRLVQVLDYGEDDGTPYVVMQLVEGRPLSEISRQHGPMPADEVAALVAAIADGLAAAHAQGIVHRDLKPSNVLVTSDGPVLVDFGVARSDETEPLTRTGEIIGTADYLSPEQVRGQRATGAADVYALGVVSYQGLTGTSPFRRDTRVATALAHLNDTPPPLPTTVPASVRGLVDDMLATDPADRPTAAQVAARAREQDEAPALDPPTETMAPARTPLRLPRPLAVAVAAAVLLVAGVVVAVTTGEDPTTPPAASELALPDVRGEQLAAARDQLESAGFTVVVHRAPAARARGLVLAQSPRPGKVTDDQKTVTLRVASGSVRLDAASLVGLPYAAAAGRLDKLGLSAARSARTTTSATAGDVVAVGRDGLVPVGTTVTLTVAQAPVVRAHTTTGHGTAKPHPGPGKGPKGPKPPKAGKPGKAKGHHKP